MIKYATSGSCLILFTNTSTFDAFKQGISLERTSEFAILLFVPVSEPTKSYFANVLTGTFKNGLPIYAIYKLH